MSKEYTQLYNELPEDIAPEDDIVSLCTVCYIKVLRYKDREELDVEGAK